VLLSLVPLVATLPQDRVRFFVAFGMFGILGPWVARDYHAPERLRRIVVRFLWRVHAVWLLLLFVPSLFTYAMLFVGGGANALDRVAPRAAAPITILLNAPTPQVPWDEAAMRANRGGIAPPVFTLYAGTQALEVVPYAERGLELHAARGWITSPFERIRDLRRAPFRAGDRIALAHLTVEVREVNAEARRRAFDLRSIARWRIRA
jgi:hypothetical protein